MSEYSQYLSPTEDIIEDARNGKMIVLVDAEDRENEGDLIIPSQMATPEAINFMAKFGRGLICMAMPQDRSDHRFARLVRARCSAAAGCRRLPSGHERNSARARAQSALVKT